MRRSLIHLPRSGAPLAIIFPLLVLLDLSWTSPAAAIPAFARKYQTSCSTCHYAYPRLNGFGRAYFNNGLRYPGGDEPVVKDEPVKLGAEGNKKAFPNAIWPADMSGLPVFSVRAIGRLDFAPDAEIKSTFEIPHEVEVLYGGTIGGAFSYFGEVELENENNEIEFAFPFYFQWDHRPAFHVRMGEIAVDPSPDHHRLGRGHYNVASLRNRTRTWRFRDGQSGLSAWGAVNGPGGRGGFRYQGGVVNGQGLNDANSDKDFFAHGTYKIGGLGEIGGTEGQTATDTGFWVDDQIKLGGFAYVGTAAGNPDTVMVEEDFKAFGATGEFWYSDLTVLGTVVSMKSEIGGRADRTSLAWFLEGDYVLFPWLISFGRYEFTDTNTDVDTPEAQKTFVPGVLIMARANVRFLLEYQLPIDDPSKENDLLTVQADFSF
jgi:hypothetical protein